MAKKSKPVSPQPEATEAVAVPPTADTAAAVETLDVARFAEAEAARMQREAELARNSGPASLDPASVDAPAIDRQPDAIAVTAPEPAPATDRSDWTAPETVEPPQTNPIGQDDRPSANEAASVTTPLPATPTATPRRAGVFPLFLGGVLTAGLGFAAGWYVKPAATVDLAPMDSRLTSQADAVAALSDRIDALPAAPDLSPVEQDIAALRADLVAATDGLRPALDDLTARLSALERAPTADGSLSETALAAWQSDLDQLRADLASQEGRIDQIAAEAAERSQANAATIAEIEAQGIEAAQRLAQRAALGRIQAALDAGTPFAEPLAELAEGGIEPPRILSSMASEGAPTLAALRDGFPAAARAALASARAEGLAEDGAGWTGTIRSLFDVRSTTPRDGSDPDAILSRAEAALRDGQLQQALTEIAALPEVVRGAMGEWLGLAHARQDALDEAAALAASMTESEG